MQVATVTGPYARFSYGSALVIQDLDPSNLYRLYIADPTKHGYSSDLVVLSVSRKFQQILPLVLPVLLRIYSPFLIILNSFIPAGLETQTLRRVCYRFICTLTSYRCTI